ncbi:hypothetical protein Nepgr_033875 [Nepenthes gracilis]|uniref:Uncharacterized protein n=1 Tax=Nepenthes gracilis TaxID=150966 RepID=A0AAD3TMQ0_NEPGR|nr:hypothetical protein Nepgr_033875 [Nepenthes gracilis]
MSPDWIASYLLLLQNIIGSMNGALSRSMIDEPANVVTNIDHPVLDVGAQFVDDHAAGTPHRPLTTLECVPIVAGSMGALQASTAGLVAVSNQKKHQAPSDFHDVSSRPLSGCPVVGHEASLAGAVQPCVMERGLVHALPISPSNQLPSSFAPGCNFDASADVDSKLALFSAVWLMWACVSPVCR